jgi:hypothetical protein
VSTTVNYRGRERYTLEGCWYHSTVQRERTIHTQVLLVPEYTTEGEKGTHARTVSTTVNYTGRERYYSRAVGTTVHYRGGERYTLKDCEYYSKLQRERKVHTRGL